MVLAQTPYPGITHRCETVPELTALLAAKGAGLLVQGLRDGVHVPPLHDVGWCKSEKDEAVIRLAPKIRPSDRNIEWALWTADEIMRRHRVIGPLWSFVESGHPNGTRRRRIIWSSGFRKVEVNHDMEAKVGHPVVDRSHSTPRLIIKTCDGVFVQPGEVKLEGESNMGFLSVAKRAGMIDLTPDNSRSSLQSSACQQNLH